MFKYVNPEIEIVEKPKSEAFSRPSFDSVSCPVPLQDYPNIILGHGGGGKLSGELVEHIFLPAFRNDHLAVLSDSAVFEVGNGRLAMSTDSFVVQPLFFPGGSIGDLAVNGTVNDLAMSGAKPLYLSVGFILEEGLPLTQLNRIAQDMGAAARAAEVTIITGDTKVVEQGHGDGCYINTAGVGVVPSGIEINPSRAQAGDMIIVSGNIGDHGMAIMSVREGLEFESKIVSDSAPLHTMVEKMLAICPDVHVLRDPTRGGLAASLNEIAEASQCGIVIDERSIPVDHTVQSACEILGLDPLHVANEGKLIAVVPAEHAQSILQVIQPTPQGKNAAVVGAVVADHPGSVIAKTPIGASRLVTVPIGEQLPRIC